MLKPVKDFCFVKDNPLPAMNTGAFEVRVSTGANSYLIAEFSYFTVKDHRPHHDVPLRRKAELQAGNLSLQIQNAMLAFAISLRSGRRSTKERNIP